MYPQILSALCEMNGLSTAKTTKEYLVGLKPAARTLWDAYQVQHVKVSYDNPEIQAVYMLRYFPQHAETLRRVLTQLPQRVRAELEQRNLRAVHFACGPAPELCGVAQFLNDSFPPRQAMSAYLHDIASSSWGYARHVTLEYLIPSVWQGPRFVAIGDQSDCTDPNLVTKSHWQMTIEKAHLVTFQLPFRIALTK